MSSGSGFWTFATTLVWPAAIISVGWLCRDHIRDLFNMLKERLRSGAAIKMAGVELGEVPVARQGGDAPYGNAREASQALRVTTDGGERASAREAIYTDARRLFIAYRLYVAADSRYLFDITLYVISHKEGSLFGVKSVDYYFGPAWKNQVFRISNRYNSFAISTSAYGPFLCTAMLTFEDGTTEELSRYVDFEMGYLALARSPLPKRDEENG